MLRLIARSCIIVLLILVICITALFRSCEKARLQDYYAEQKNYVSATGTVTYISYHKEGTELFYRISDTSYKFSDTSFKIAGKNLKIVQEKGIDEKVKVGDKITFVSAPGYFYDAYVMPIVALSVNGETLLDFDEGFKNLQEWLANGN